MLGITVGDSLEAFDGLTDTEDLFSDVFNVGVPHRKKFWFLKKRST